MNFFLINTLINFSFISINTQYALSLIYTKDNCNHKWYYVILIWENGIVFA